MENNGTLIISGFPGVGKSYFYNNYQNKFSMLDSDSSEFSWNKDSEGHNTKERNPDFPNNYIQHIKKNIGKVDIIFVSSHDVVRKALKDNDIKYIIIYPAKPCKEEYMNRYIKRGNDYNFIKLLETHWDCFLNELELDDFPTKCRLWNDEYLKDILVKDYCPMYKEFCSVNETYADEYEGTFCNKCDCKTKLI